MKKKNRIGRIVAAVILVILSSVYMYKDLSNRPFSDDYGKPWEPENRTVKEETADLPAETVTEDAAPEESVSEKTETPETEVKQTVNPGSLPDVDINSWELMLVNADNSIDDYVPETEQLEGQELDKRIIEPVQNFVAAARAEGLNVYLASGYRDYNTQNYLYNRKVGQGYSAEEAAKIEARPGTSEHQTGLACDITDKYYEQKDSSLENTDTYIWMSQHCQDYGFIVRYPENKEDVTGVTFEPWHFRYVGEEAAKYIMGQGICLEEFIELYK